jgi:hypothetical protein
MGAYGRLSRATRELARVSEAIEPVDERSWGYLPLAGEDYVRVRGQSRVHAGIIGGTSRWRGTIRSAGCLADNL